MRSNGTQAVSRVFFVVWITGMVLLITGLAEAQLNKTGKVSQKDGEVTVLVTVKPDNERTRLIADRLQPTDFAVLEKKRPQEIISVRKADTEPLVLAVLIQDDLVGRVNNELDGIREFIKGLPEGSRVMTAYLTSGTIRVRQDFTEDRELAAKSLRIILSSNAASPYNPYVEVIEAINKFSGQPSGRKMILLVSDGLDISHGFRSGSPSMSIDLDRAILAAQREGVSIFTYYAPSVGLTSYSRLAMNFGQGSLLRIADETGGEAFFTGSDFVSFAPYFREVDELMNNQWLITYRSNNTGKDFRRIEVTTDFDVHLQYPAGYSVK
jgi:VWFA-related protein